MKVVKTTLLGYMTLLNDEKIIRLALKQYSIEQIVLYIRYAVKKKLLHLM